jgi:acetyltransferase
MLDPEDIRMRIFQTRRELPHSELARLTQIDYDREMAFIAEALDAQGMPETLGVARTVSDPDHVEAEFALLVRSDLKGAGLGTLLFDRLIEHAGSRGIERLVGIVLRENARMLKLARRMGFEFDPAEPAASGVRRVVRTLDSPPGEASASTRGV